MPKIDRPKSSIPERLEGLHLFHFDGAPCAQRVRFALGEKGLSRGREEKFDSVSPGAVKGKDSSWVSRRVSLVKKDHMTQTYADIHPNMVVPALVHNGTLYLESMDIIEYLDSAFGGTMLIPTDPEMRAATMERVEQAKELHKSIRYVSFYWGLGRLAILNSKDRGQLAELARQGTDGENLVSFYEGYSQRTIPRSVYMEHLRKLHSAFSELDEELTDGRKFLMSDDITIADAFWSMKLLKVLECGYPVNRHHPNLYRWYQRVSRRPSFRNEVMTGNRLSNRFFRAKSYLENLLGVGLAKAVTEIKHDN
jgi:glutathione S-transferase